MGSAPSRPGWLSSVALAVGGGEGTSKLLLAAWLSLRSPVVASGALVATGVCSPSASVAARRLGGRDGSSGPSVRRPVVPSCVVAVSRSLPVTGGAVAFVLKPPVSLG